MSATIQNAMMEGATSLAAGGIKDSRSEATRLLMHVLHCDRAFLFTHSEGLLSADQDAQFRDFIRRRAKGYPLQYITGHQEFFRLDFEVTPDVLVPRPETELVVEAGLEILKDSERPRFVDVGTGSGCIVISLLHELPTARAVALDASAAALAVTGRNARRHQVLDRLELSESDLFSTVGGGETFDAIFSNPPYVPTNDLLELQREVKHEPQSALDGGADGLDLVRRLLEEAPKFLRRRGHLVFEIGFDQAEMVRELVDESVWDLIEIRKDLQGIPRTVVLRKRATLR